MAMEANFNIMKALSLQIKQLEKCILQQTIPMDNFEFLKSIDGIGVSPGSFYLRQGISTDSKAPETMHRTAVALIAVAKVMVNAKVKTTRKTATNFSAGPTLKRQIT